MVPLIQSGPRIFNKDAIRSVRLDMQVHGDPTKGSATMTFLGGSTYRIRDEEAATFIGLLSLSPIYCPIGIGQFINLLYLAQSFFDDGSKIYYIVFVDGSKISIKDRDAIETAHDAINGTREMFLKAAERAVSMVEVAPATALNKLPGLVKP